MEVKIRQLLRSALLVLLLVPVSARAQDELRLTIRKDFGFRAGSRIQGRFTLGVDGPQDLVRVRFEIDGSLMAEANQAPFQHRFNTSEYGLGEHTLTATGLTSGGAELQSSSRRFEFVSANAAWEAAGSIAIPLAAGVLLLVVVVTLAPAMLGRKRAFKLGEYGSAGGAVCPRCELPYSRSFFSPNLLVGKLGRCPHCGKWAVVARAGREALDEAEARLRAEDQSQIRQPRSERERLRRMVDESRYDD
jgi:hypothetical protein